MPLDQRLGFEIELLAPAGSSRLTLAETLARRCGGRVVRRFHADAEPSAAPGIGVFHHLTPAFTVLDAAGRPLCSLVDDITLQADLDRTAPAEPGWYRILSDDPRLLRLAARQCDPGAPLDRCLDPVAELYGTEPTRAGALVRVDDAAGATVALAAPLPGERHRACEIVTPPIASDHAARLDALLAPARELGFSVPAEAAVHVHADASRLRHPVVMRHFVRLAVASADVLREMVATNPACRRLGPLPDALVDLVEDPSFVAAPWDEARARLAALPLTKYADVNLRNVVAPPRGKDTVEWRILPGTLEARDVIEGAELFCALLDRAAASPPPPRRWSSVPAGIHGSEELLGELGLGHRLGTWLERQIVVVSAPG